MVNRMLAMEGVVLESTSNWSHSDSAVLCFHMLTWLNVELVIAV